MAAACCTTNTRACCPLPPTVATPCLMDWTVAAYTAAAPGTVAIADTYGNILGSGFWVNGYSVVTAWHVVGRESLGIRVVITVAGTVPTSLDGVLTFAIPGFDLALISVNPNLYPPGYTPLVLAMSTNAATGQEVYSVSAALGHDPNTFAVGYVREASYTDIGTITDVLTSIPHYPGSSGAAVIRKSDNTIIAMVQYDFSIDVDTPIVVPGSLGANVLSIPTPSYSGGVGAALVRAFMALAGTATTGGASVTGAYYFPGAVTYPTLRDNFALGMQKAAGVVETTSVAYVPLMAAGVQVQALPVGSPAYGSLVYDPTVTDIGDDGWGTLMGDLAIGSNGKLQLVSADFTAAFDAGYVRASVPYVSIIGAPGLVVTCNAEVDYFNADTGFFDFYAWANATYDGEGGAENFQFTISIESDGGNRHDAINIKASASGWVTFDSVTAFASMTTPAEMEPIIATPAESLYLFGAPFASSDFILVDRIPNYSQAPGLGVPGFGEPGGPLRLSMLVALAEPGVPSGVVTFQWDGFSQTTLDPVSFQVVLTCTSSVPNVNSGQMQFNYGVLPGTWAGNPWLAASQLTSFPAYNLASPLPSSTQMIQIVDQPRMGEAIYFGTAAFQQSAQLPLSVSVVGDDTSSRLKRVVAPRRLPNGALPTVPVGSSSSSSTATVVGTFAACIGSTFLYAILSYDWTPTVLRIASLNGSAVGYSNLNTPSLTDAIIATGSIFGTQLLPKLLSGVSVIETTPSAPLALTLAQRNAILSAPVNLGPGASTVSTAAYLPATSKFDWTPSAGTYYASSLFYVQPTPNPREVFNYASVAFTITFVGETLLNSGANNGLIVLQLAAADSTSLLTQFAEATSVSPTCVVIYCTGGSGNTYTMEYRNGYGGAVVGTPTTGSIAGTHSLDGTLTYDTSDFTQRPNVLVMGLPPRAGNDPSSSPYTSPKIGALVAATVQLKSVLVADQRSLVVPIPTTEMQFAVTTERNVARPSFYNPVALKR
jgi:hypothetical protein